MATEIESFCEAFILVGELAYKLGARSIKDLPGCYELAIDDHWWVAINGHLTPTECSRGPEVLPCHMLVQYNGWPAGLFDAAGGVFVSGSEANESRFVEAINQALGKLEGAQWK